MVYLRASVPTLQARIARRARKAEQSIGADYLEQLNRRYEEWFRRFDLCPVLTVTTDELNLLDQPTDRQLFVDQVRQALGLEADGELQPGLPGIDRTAMVE
jgi:hypothetical protein